MRAFFAVVFLLYLVSGCLGQTAGNPDNWCREGFFTRDADDFGVSVVTGSKNERVYFFNDENPQCPNAESCRSKAYLVPGDRVVTNRSKGPFTCGWYVSVKGPPTVGWIRTSDLQPVTVPMHGAVSKWLGEWRYAGNAINFTDNKLAGYLNVTGDAVWRGLGDNVHVGEIDGRYTPEKGIINYSDGDDEYSCRAKLRLLGDFLIVSDNLKCGGLNVTFSGIYTRSVTRRSLR